MGRLHPEYQCLVIFIELAQHVGWRDILSIVVSNSLQTVDVANRANSRATDLPHAFCDIVRNRQDLVAVLVEQQVIIAEVGRSCASENSLFSDRGRTHLPKGHSDLLKYPSPLQERCPMEFLVVLHGVLLVRSWWSFGNLLVFAVFDLPSLFWINQVQPGDAIRSSREAPATWS
jgi:hypothetical protein